MEEARLNGRWLARLRIQAGVAQHELAHRCGIAPETLSRLERGHTQPRAETVREIARALGVEVKELYVRWDGK